MLSVRALFNNTSAIDMVGVIGLFLVAFFCWVGIAGAYLGFFLLLVASLFQWRQPDFRLFFSQPVTLLLLAFVLYVVGWELVMRLSQYTEYSGSVSKEWFLLVFPWCGYWLYRFPCLIPYVMFAAVAGLFIESVNIASGQWDEFISAWQGGRVFVARAWGLYFSVVTLGLIVLVPRFFSYSNSWKLRNIARLSYLLCIGWFVQCLVATQARAAWISFLVMLSFVAMNSLFRWYKRCPQSKAIILGLVVVVVTLSVVVVSSNSDSILKRFSKQDGENFEKILAGDDDLTYTSVTHRYLIYKYGIEQWLRSPMLGNGPVESSVLITKHEDKNLHVVAHFHSAYIELLVQFGVIGVILFFLPICLLLYELLRGYLATRMAGDYVFLIFGVFLVIFLWSFLNFRMLKADWRFFWIILVGVSQAIAMRYRYRVS